MTALSSLLISFTVMWKRGISVKLCRRICFNLVRKMCIYFCGDGEAGDYPLRSVSVFLFVLACNLCIYFCGNVEAGDFRLAL
jgi:hypothetical protein